MSNPDTNESSYDIAIIGLAGRFPGAKTVEQFWLNLREGVESISFFSDEQLQASGIETSALKDPGYVKASAVLDDIELFDASFFGFYPREAEMMDPQQRLFLETAWEALESAGYNPEAYEGRIGVYAGVSKNRYLLYHLATNPKLAASLDTIQTIIGNDRDFLTTHVSYKLNLKGPGVTVQTACSTSLVAVHLACQSLLSGECDMAMAGGVSVRLLRREGYFYEQGGIHSPDGHCRAFDAKAEGTVNGDGVGIVVLKRLADAVADGDNIHAVIKGSAINNDGSAKIGYTAPSVNGQAAVIAEALAMAGVDPETVSYVEAHGTGTPLGDPIEMAALMQAFQGVKQRGCCAIGSVKSNIGHLDAAAGIAGLIKTVLALKNRMLPPSLNFERPNPQIDFSSSPFYVNAALSEWRANAAPLRAGVSSFGIGGTNAHVVLEESPARQTSIQSRSHHLLPLSAKSESALDLATANLAGYLKNHSDVNIADVAYTLQVGRVPFYHRRVIVCRDADDAVTALEAMDSNRVFTYSQGLRDRSVAFMFPGQGSQYANMSAGLYVSEPEFRRHVDLCADILAPMMGIDLQRVLYAQEGRDEEAARQIEQTFIAQPALFAVEYALAQLWMKWGIRPQAMIGHSIGEYVAACLAGVFSVEDGLRLVAARGRLMQELPAGSMLAVPLSEKDVLPLLEDSLSLAAINGKALCVVSGPEGAIERLEQRLTEQDTGCRRLHTSHAFHSEMMDPILDRFADEVRKVRLNPPQIPFISNVTGAWITESEATDPAYWATHLRRTVRFSDGIAELSKEQDRVLLEVGPGHTLNKLAKSGGGEVNARLLISSMRQPTDEHLSDIESLLAAAGRLWVAGVQIDWPALYSDERRCRVQLPTYPFERQRYWIEPQSSVSSLLARSETLERKADMADWFYVPRWNESPLPEKVKQDEQASEQACWLVFVDACGLGSQLIEELKQRSQDVIAVVAGEQFSKSEGQSYRIHPARREDYDALLREVGASGKVARRVIHLWNVTADDRAQQWQSRSKDIQAVSFYSLLFLAQALGEQAITDQLSISVVSNNLHDVTGEEHLSPVKALLLGPCRVIPQEYQNITCRSIDVVIPEGKAVMEKLAGQILGEIEAGPPDSIIAYRRNHRWVEALQAVRLKEQAGLVARLRGGGVYLITGGLTEFGLVIAKYLAQATKPRLVLMDRTTIPDRSDWEQYIAERDKQDGPGQVIGKLLRLEQLGAELLLINAGTDDAQQVQSAIARAVERFGEINGVVHAEAVQGEGLIQFKTEEMAAGVLAPRVTGTLALEAALTDTRLDFFALFSSTISLMGGFGLVDYCAANAFLDAFAHYKSSQDAAFTVSIDWGQLRWDDWQESLMSNMPEMQAQFKEAREAFGITLDESAEAFSRILSCGLAQVIVSTQDFEAVLEQTRAVTASGFLDQLNEMRESEEAHSRPELNTTYVPPSNEIEQAIVEIVRDLFGIEGVGVNDNFFDIGGNSLVAITFISRLRKAFDVELSIGALFEAPTVAGLASLIAESQLGQEDADELNRLLGEIEGLSLDEVQAQLAREAQMSNEGNINE